MQVPAAAPLSSMSTDAVCERLKQIGGIDPGMLPQYTSTIKKVRLLITLHLLFSVHTLYSSFLLVQSLLLGLAA